MSAKRLLFVGVLLFLCHLPTSSWAEDLWVTPLAREKGEDYLFVVNLEHTGKERGRPRRIRCSTSLPIYIEEMAKSAERVEGELLMRVRVKVVQPKVGGEMVQDLKILMVCVVPDTSKPHLLELKKWQEFSQALPEEKSGDPFGPDGELVPAKPVKQ